MARSPTLIRSAVVTGAGAGIGRAIVERLAAEDWFVVGIELDEIAANEVRHSLGDSGTIVDGDVRTRAVLQHAADIARAAAPLRGWVNNAGILAAAALPGHPEDLLDVVLAVNVEATLWGCETAVRSFLDQEVDGAIVNISSIHGRRSFRDHVAYDMSKGAIDALTRNVAVSHGDSGIRVNAVAPGAVRTPMMERGLANALDREAAESELAGCIPLGRVGGAYEIAAVVGFLLSDDASYVSGQSIAVDGGWAAGGETSQPRT